MTELVALLLVLQTLLAFGVVWRDRSHAAIAWWSAAMSIVWIARASAEALGAPWSALETGCIAIGALGGWAVSRRVMEGGRGLVAMGAGSAVIVVGAHPELTTSVREWLHATAWIAGTLGAFWSILRVILSRRTAEPKVAHFMVLAYTGLAAAQLAVRDGLSGEKPLVAATIGAAAAVAAQAAWIATRSKRRRSDVRDRPEQPRRHERGGHLVDVARPIRRRAPRRSRADGGVGEP